MDEVARQTDGIRRLDCIESVAVDTLSSPMTLLIDFGTEGSCEDIDGVVRTGKIHCTFNGRYTDVGTTINISTQNYSVDGYSVDATQSVQFLGDNIEGIPAYDVHSEMELTAPGGGWTSVYSADQERLWVEGDISSWWIDDVYEITGSVNGINRNGTTYKAEIIAPLRMEVLCPFVIEGVVQVSPQDQILRTIDYGSGECNPTASLSVGNAVFTISQ
jgi:hypothetical protein